MTTAIIEGMAHSIRTHNGAVTMYNPATGAHRTIRISTQSEDANFAPGQRIVSLLTGPDNTSDYTGFGFLTDEGEVRIWRKKHGGVYEAYARMLTEPEAYMARGIQYKFDVRCRRCNRELTDPISIDLGIGPTCREKP